MPDQVPPEQKDFLARLLQAAIEEAQAGLAEGGIPIGSALGTPDGEIIGRGHNMRVQQVDPRAHAEISCMRNAGRRPHFRGLILASTLMPCCLCAGAAIQFGIGTVVVGESRNFPGERALMESRGIKVYDLDDPTCIKLMGEFVRTRPELWNEDIGAEE